MSENRIDNMTNDELAREVSRGFGCENTGNHHDALWVLVQRAGIRTAHCPRCDEEFDVDERKPR